MKKAVIIMAAVGLSLACTDKKQAEQEQQVDSFDYNVESFADLGILRYQVTGWETLSLEQKKLIYHLSEAAQWGRDILFDQNNRYNLAIRRTLEAIYTNYADKTNPEFARLEIYLKRVWFSNGIHHHYGEEKFLPEFSQEFFAEAVKALPIDQVPTRDGQSVDAFLAELTPVMFDPAVDAKKVVQDPTVDVILHSGNNFYAEGITQQEVESFYGKMRDPKDQQPPSYGLNSRLVKKNGRITEDVYKVGGLYSPAIEKIVACLEEALPYAENEEQRLVIDLLIAYYKTGNLKTYDEYSIAWVKDVSSLVDFVNGFTETYGDALGLKATWESLVNFKDQQATAVSELISNNAQWFEDHSPVDDRFKKKEVKGVTAKVITAAMLGGACYPATPIGINLPNANWIRRDYGSKSVTITNITEAYDKAAAGSGFNDEFAYGEDIKVLMDKYLSQTNNLHTDLHECLGHGSGQLLPGVQEDALGIYGSTIEEARADLFGLYYMPDAKILELGLLDNKDAYKAEYYKYMMNGLLTQLSRIEPGKNIEESHMRNRALIARWVLEHGQANQVVELIKEEGKTYVKVNDFEGMRSLIGQLLREIQRIKSEGDFAGAQAIVEKYAVQVDPALHQEILERYNKLNIAPYKGFVNPVYHVHADNEGNITDVHPTYAEGYAEQMLRYAKSYSPLPTYND
ncbi:dipeptidyl peptidase 3 [Bacteroidales bacterium OttesenSCG-928-J19]|nr:dipeptidyl peptidase 3 [Bacteroidales bacterium OttesenSCG-928-J19]